MIIAIVIVYLAASFSAGLMAATFAFTAQLDADPVEAFAVGLAMAVMWPLRLLHLFLDALIYLRDIEQQEKP